MCGPGCRCSETSVLYPVKEFNASPTRKDALVLDRYCATSIACPKITSSQEKFIRVPDFIRTVSLNQTQAQFAKLPSTDARGVLVPVRWFERAYVKMQRLLASSALFLRIARIRRAPGYFTYSACCHLRYALHSTAWSLLPSISRDRQYEPWTARLKNFSSSTKTW